MCADEKLAYFKKPNVLAMILALLLGPAIGMAFAVGVISLIAWSYEYVFLMSGMFFAPFICAFFVPTVFRYQKEKKYFVFSCSLLGGLVGLVMGFGTFSLYTGLFGICCAFYTALLYKLIIRFSYRLKHVF